MAENTHPAFLKAGIKKPTFFKWECFGKDGGMDLGVLRSEIRPRPLDVV